MALTKQGYVLSGIIILLFAAVNILAITTPSDSPLRLAVRLCALNGYLAVAIAAIMTPFLGKVARAFGKPFLRVHHLFAAFGIALVTLHPVSLAVLRANPLVFLPSASSPLVINLGRLALFLLYVAVVGSFLRTRVTQWRYLHALMYAVLILGLIHALYLGTDFENGIIRAIYILLGAGVVLSLALGLRLKAARRRPGSRAPATTGRS